MDKVYKNTNYINSMGIDLKNLSSANLNELEQLRETIDDRIHIIKGKISLRKHPGYGSDEVKSRLLKCLKK